MIRPTPSSYCISAFFLLSVLFCSSRVFGQSEEVHASGSNLLRVGDGKTIVGNTDVNKRYLEEIANARIFFRYLSLGLRYELDDPSEVGRSFQGIRRRWIQYKKNQLELQAGDVNALFGRGLAINLFESRALNFDTWLDGVYGKTEFQVPEDWLNFKPSIGIRGVAGKTDFYPIDTTQPMMSISARSANAELNLFSKSVVLGATFLQAFTGVNMPGPFNTTFTTNREVNQPDLYLDVNQGEFAAFLEWTENRAHATKLLSSNVDTSHAGHAVYGSLSYANENFGVTLEYKNYGYYLHAPNSPYENVFSKLPISNPPEVYREITYTTISRTNHAVNFDDELGVEAEFNITAIPSVTINLNGAASSRHTKYDQRGIAVDSTSILPKFDDLGFWPYWEAFAEVEWDFDSANAMNYTKFAVHRRSDVIVYNAANPLQTDRRRMTTVAGKIQYETTPTQSILLILEHQWEFDASRTVANKNVTNSLISTQYSFPWIAFGGMMDMMSPAEKIGNEPTFWPQGFISIKMGESHTLLASYGKERGGLNCTGGICRIVPPFNGLRLTLTSQI